MEFYKILRQRKVGEDSFCHLLDLQKYEYIMGNHPNSFAIKYDPETFNQFLNYDIVFREYKNKSIQQLFVTNQKFLAILNHNHFFNMKMKACLFVEDPKDKYLDEYDELSIETIEDVVDRYGFHIKEVIFTTDESKRKIILQKNGVIGIDNELTSAEQSEVLKFIDTLNFGLKVIDK